MWGLILPLTGIFMMILVTMAMTFYEILPIPVNMDKQPSTLLKITI